MEGTRSLAHGRNAPNHAVEAPKNAPDLVPILPLHTEVKTVWNSVTRKRRGLAKRRSVLVTPTLANGANAQRAAVEELSNERERVIHRIPRLKVIARISVKQNKRESAKHSLVQ